MFSSRATTPARYVAGLSEAQRAAVSTVRKVVLKHLPKGYRESVSYGMLTYCIPLSDYPDTYNGQPLCYVGLGAHQKYCSLYLMSAYGDPEETAWLAAAFKKAGKKLDMGKACLHFKTAADLPLDVIGAFVARTTPEAFIARCEAAHASATRRRKQRQNR